MRKKGKVRSCQRSRSLKQDSSNRLHRQICLGIEREEYNRIWHDAQKVRELVDQQMMKSPELFPVARCRKEHDLPQRVWDVYRAETAEKFQAGMDELLQWMNQQSWPNAVRQAVEKLAERESEYAKSYSHPQCLRTSNMIDRLMNRLTRYLYDGRGLHGHQGSSELRLRGWALLRNFTPYAPRSNHQRIYSSPAYSLNQKVYHHH